MKKIYLFPFIAILFLLSCDDYDDIYMYDDGGQAKSDFYKVNWAAAVDSSTTAFVDRYWSTEKHCFKNTFAGEIQDNDYWPEAHGLDVIVDAYIRTGDSKYKQIIYDWYEGVKKKNWYGDTWQNEYFDDMGWHGMAHMRALEATGDTRYENSAKELWQWITEGWTDYQGGGIQWREGADSENLNKGIPANGPAAIIAARRAKKYPDETVNGFTNLQWAQRIYTWMKEYRVIWDSGRIFENIDNTNNDYSYDVGTFLGAALELYDITKDKSYFEDAIKITDYHITHNINKMNGVMKDYGEQAGEGGLGGGNDCNLFKGIFVRYFTIFIQHPDLSAEDRARYVAFLKNNAEYLWIKGTEKTPDIKFSYTWWEIPPSTARWGDLRSAISAATTIEAMALLEKQNLLN